MKVEAQLKLRNTMIILSTSVPIASGHLRQRRTLNDYLFIIAPQSRMPGEPSLQSDIPTFVIVGRVSLNAPRRLKAINQEKKIRRTRFLNIS